MRACTAILIGLFFLASCNRKETLPSNILPQDKMQAIMWDLTRSDIYLADYLKRADSMQYLKPESIKLYAQVFRIHATTKESFQQSLDFYKLHPLLFKPLLDSLSNFAHDAARSPYRTLLKDSASNPLYRHPPGQDTSKGKKTVPNP